MELRIDPRSAITDYAGKQIADALESIAIARSADIDITNFNQIREIVKLGRAKDFFEIGDQIHTTWSPDGETTYDMPWDVVDFGPATDPDGKVHENAMWLESHYALQAVQFDQCEAFYVAPEAMPAGTYHFMLGDALSPSAQINVPFMFTLTKAVPAGGMLIIGDELSDEIPVSKALSNWRVRVYANGAQIDPDEIVEISQGDDGAELGTLLPGTPYSEKGLNDIYRWYGYNRWSQSALRQWLNSDKPANEWWKQQNPFDRRPKQITTARGFTVGLPAEFLTIVKPVKVVTALNHSTDKAFGESEATIDRFFLASLEQEYIVPRWHGEGKVFEYWKSRLTVEQQQGSLGKRSEHIRYSIADNATAVPVRLRSVHESYSNLNFLVNTVGSVIKTMPFDSSVVAPVCVIY